VKEKEFYVNNYQDFDMLLRCCIKHYVYVSNLAERQEIIKSECIR